MDTKIRFSFLSLVSLVTHAANGLDWEHGAT